jgi:hypothetical protein
VPSNSLEDPSLEKAGLRSSVRDSLVRKRREEKWTWHSPLEAPFRRNQLGVASTVPRNSFRRMDGGTGRQNESSGDTAPRVTVLLIDDQREGQGEKNNEMSAIRLGHTYQPELLMIKAEACYNLRWM